MQVRLLVDFMDDDGQEAAESLDTDRLTGGLVLGDYVAKSVLDLQLGAAAVDQAVTFTAALMLLVVSSDYPFKLRLAAGQAQMPNARLWMVMTDDEDEAAHTTSILLSGNGTNPAQIKVYILEKPA